MDLLPVGAAIMHGASDRQFDSRALIPVIMRVKYFPATIQYNQSHLCLITLHATVNRETYI